MTYKNDEIYFEFDPFELVGRKPPIGKISEAKREIADLVLDAVLDYVGDGSSPVANGKWKRSLSPAYMKIKREESSAGFANMELSGDMLDSLEVVNSGSKLRLRIKDSTEAAKADGHNNHSGRSKLPQRQFIPKEGETFKRSILSEIRNIIDEFS